MPKRTKSIQSKQTQRPGTVSIVRFHCLFTGLAERIYEQRPWATGRGGIELSYRPDGAQDQRSEETTSEGKTGTNFIICIDYLELI